MRNNVTGQHCSIYIDTHYTSSWLEVFVVQHCAVLFCNVLRASPRVHSYVLHNYDINSLYIIARTQLQYSVIICRITVQVNYSATSKCNIARLP